MSKVVIKLEKKTEKPEKQMKIIQKLQLNLQHQT